MKTFITLAAAMAITSSLAFGDMTQTMTQNRFQTMSTDELLEKRGTALSTQEQEQLRYELQNRQQSMTKDQSEKLMNKAQNRVQNRNENRTMNAYKTGQDNMRGQGGGMMESQGMRMGGGGGGRGR